MVHNEGNHMRTISLACACACAILLSGCVSPQQYSTDAGNIVSNTVTTVNSATTIVGDIASGILALGKPITEVFSYVSTL